MASRYIFTTVIDPSPSLDNDWSLATSGGTITGASGVVELVFDDTAFTGAEGKKRLLLALKSLEAFLEDGKRDWPLST